LLVFIHVPRTAGTTFRVILYQNEPEEHIRVLPNVFKGSGGLDKGPMRQMPEGEGSLDTELQDLDRVSILRGHVPYGLREYLPQYLPKGRKVRWCTFLREPNDRLLSHYFGAREIRRPVPGATVPWSELPAEPTLDELIDAGYLHDNLQTRMLCGLPEPFGEVTDAMLEQAKRSLRDGLAFVGITERFDESVVIAKRRLGLSTILSTPERVNPERPRRESVPGELAQAAERANRYDIELYRYACELFDAAPELRDLEFQVEVAALRAARGTAEIADDVPVPEGWVGSKREWRMLLRARAALLVSDQTNALDDELRAMRAKVKELQVEVKRLRRAAREGGEMPREPTGGPGAD
jgi:hypothetical protein